MQATPCPCVPHLRLYHWCRVSSPRVWGYPALGSLPPRNGSTNSPLCFWSCWQGGLSAMPAPPLWGHCLLPITSSWDNPSQAMSWGTPTGCPDAPCPDKGAAPEPAMPWHAMGKAWGGHPHLYLLQRETIYREIYIFKLILKDLFLSLQPHPAAQGAGRERADPLPTGGSRNPGAQTCSCPPLHGQLTPSNVLVCASVSPAARMGRLEIMDVPQWRKGACCSPTHRRGFGRGRSLEWSLLCQAPELSHDHSPLCHTHALPRGWHRLEHAQDSAH